MLTETQKSMIHLDNIRIHKKMTVEILCDGICGDRLYRKYLSGTTNISEKRLMEFVSKLGISPRDFYYSLYSKDKYDFSEIKNLYVNLTSLDKTFIQNKLDYLSKIQNLSSHNQRFLNYVETTYLFDTKEIHELEAISRYSEICNYPKCIKQSAFDFVDMISLHKISQIEYKVNRYDALNLLIRVLKDDEVKYLSSDNSNLLPSIYSNVSIILGRLGKYEEVLSIANQGVSFCLNNDNMKSLSRLYYSLSMAYKHLKNGIMAEKYAALCFSNVISRNNAEEIQHFYKLIENDFNKDPFRIITESKNTLLTKKAG